MIPALILAALTAAADPAPTVTPEPACARTLDEMASQLSEQYGERAAGGGAELSGGGVLLFVRPDRKSWTLVYFESLTTPACIVGAGSGWRSFSTGEGL